MTCNSVPSYPRVGQPAPDFKCSVVHGDDSDGVISLKDFHKKKNVLLIFYPFDFTFVCPTEILGYNEKKKEFDALNTEVIFASIDSIFVHKKWKEMKVTEGGIGKIQMSMIADVNHELSSLYGVLLPEGMATRGLFYIDMNGILQHLTVNNLNVGRSVDETLRVIEAIQFTQSHSGHVCPLNWKRGDKTIKV